MTALVSQVAEAAGTSNAAVPSFHHPLAVRRRPSQEVRVGNLVLGGDYPVRVQSMLTCPTWDMNAVLKEMLQLQAAGCEMVRLTVPTRRDLKALANIRSAMTQHQLNLPLAADIHFNPQLAIDCIPWVEKVRINPGNFVDQKRFQLRDYTDAQYAEELQRVEAAFTPLLAALKQANRALRIGVNHGSLSDRILNRWGDTPEGMVECAMEYLRICQRQHFQQVVVSMKASNPLVAVQAYRLTAQRMEAAGMSFPLHLGVTEAGGGLEGRCKSAVGIGTLLCDGLGNTIRVSLTEAAEAEIPVAQALISAAEYIAQGPSWPALSFASPMGFYRRPTRTVQLGGAHIGGEATPALLGMAEADFTLPALGRQEVFDAQLLASDHIHPVSHNTPPSLCLHPLALAAELLKKPQPMCLLLSAPLLQDPHTRSLLASLRQHTPGGLLVLDGPHWLQAGRRLVLWLEEIGLNWPLAARISKDNHESTRMQTAVAIGALAVDGLVDAIVCSDNNPQGEALVFCQTLMQAARLRAFKTEYISCPSCGRTLFDLQETTDRIRERTVHLKGLKIGVMGCIVNGPGEMADADFGYIGGAPGKINLYKGQQCVQRGIPTEQAVERLVDLLKQHGAWQEPPAAL